MPTFYDNGTDLFLPHIFGDYTEVDARMFYDLDSWRIQLSATNLLDEKYYSPSYLFRLSGGVHVNPPRQFLMEVTRKF
jgi:outer membrane receptor protein involved in Fe transport